MYPSVHVLTLPCTPEGRAKHSATFRTLSYLPETDENALQTCSNVHFIGTSQLLFPFLRVLYPTRGPPGLFPLLP